MVSIIKKLRSYDQLTRQTLHSSHRHWDKAIMALKPLQQISGYVGVPGSVKRSSLLRIICRF
jgi:hypothetical protein